MVLSTWAPQMMPGLSFVIFLLVLLFLNPHEQNETDFRGSVKTALLRPLKFPEIRNLEVKSVVEALVSEYIAVQGERVVTHLPPHSSLIIGLHTWFSCRTGYSNSEGNLIHYYKIIQSISVES